MKRTVLILCIFLVPSSLLAQKYITRNGYISFYGKTPLENIFAANNQVASILDTGSGEIVFQGLIKSFRFEKALMEEHFNENFIDSDKYPRFTFKGKIINPEAVNFSKPGKYDASVRGEMTINNVTRQMVVNGIFEVGEGTIGGSSEFKITPEDYNIAIPSMLREKIAKEMDVSVDVKYLPMK